MEVDVWSSRDQGKKIINPQCDMSFTQPYLPWIQEQSEMVNTNRFPAPLWEQSRGGNQEKHTHVNK